jgi:hypothetical protein
MLRSPVHIDRCIDLVGRSRICRGESGHKYRQPLRRNCSPSLDFLSTSSACRRLPPLRRQMHAAIYQSLIHDWCFPEGCARKPASACRSGAGCALELRDLGRCDRRAQDATPPNTCSNVTPGPTGGSRTYRSAFSRSSTCWSLLCSGCQVSVVAGASSDSTRTSLQGCRAGGQKLGATRLRRGPARGTPPLAPGGEVTATGCPTAQPKG